jgi:CRISPR system Cascade subunit CasD
MIPDNQILALYFDSPFQSWGYQSRFDRRTTLSYPTRSGIIGMICAAMGTDRGNRDAIRRLNSLVIEVYCFQQSGRLIDYHTVGGGYDNKREQQYIVRTAEGKVGNTVVTYREYLQNAKYIVLLLGEKQMLWDIGQALQNPRWGMWFGRKCCIPASPIFQGLHNSREEILKQFEKLIGRKAYRVIREVTNFAEGTDTVMDTPLDFFERRFAPRRVQDTPL